MRETHVHQYKQRSRTGFHLVMTVLTGGVWAFTGWPLAAVWNYFRTGRKTWTTVRERDTNVG